MYSNRRIISSYNRRKFKASYGVVLYNTTTDKYLAVKKRYTYAYSRLLCGIYKDINQYELLEQLTVREAIKIVLNTKNIKTYTRLLDEIGIQRNTYNISISLDKIKRCDTINKCKKLLLSNKLLDDIYWTWPKGNKNKGETNIACAIRELKEETGVDINTISYTVKGECLCNSFKSEDLIEYRVRVFVIHTPDIIDLCYEYDRDEIASVKWITLDELKSNCCSGYLLHLDKYT